MTTRYFSSLIEQSLSRSTEATLSIMGVTNPQLREHLAQQMGLIVGNRAHSLLLRYSSKCLDGRSQITRCAA